MQKPTLAHSASYCECTNKEELINQKWFVWILEYNGPSTVIAFDSLKSAHKHGEEHIYLNSTTHVPRDADTKYFRGALWTDADGRMLCVPDMDWDMTICDIIHDVEVDTVPSDGIWQILSTRTCQVFIGRGNDLPRNKYVSMCVGTDGYYLDERFISAEEFAGHDE